MKNFKYDYIIDLNSNSTHARVLRLVGKNKSVLEVGCATGYMSKVLKENLNCRVTGLELNTQALEQAKQFCDLAIAGDVEEIDLTNILAEKKFDVILFADVLEHLKNPWECLKKVRPLLNADGRVIASIPNVAHASIILELFNGNFDYRSLGLLDESHLRFFTYSSIKRMFYEAGLQIIQVERVIVPPPQTEFFTNLALYDEQILNLINQNNVEANTYQFIIVAC